MDYGIGALAMYSSQLCYGGELEIGRNRMRYTAVLLCNSGRGRCNHHGWKLLEQMSQANGVATR